MGLALDPSGNRAWSVAGDNLIVRYDLTAEVGFRRLHLRERLSLILSQTEVRSRAYKTAYPGRAGLAVRDDGRILAIAGWDGFVRVHSAKTFKPLAVLEYHRESVYCVAFADVASSSNHQSASLEKEFMGKGRPWLAAAGKDERISLWELYPPSASNAT
jgi:WD40 repeat protein